MVVKDSANISVIKMSMLNVKKSTGFRWNAKWLPLTWPCPKENEEHPFKLIIEKSGIEYFTKHFLASISSEFRREIETISLWEEEHESGKAHYHADLELWNRCNRTMKSGQGLTILGVVTNKAETKKKEKKLKFSKYDWRVYITKDNNCIYESGTDLKKYIYLYDQKEAVSMIKLAERIKDGWTNDKIDDITPQHMLCMKKKIDEYRSYQEVKNLTLPKIKKLTFRVKTQWEKIIKKWFNLYVEGKRTKKTRGLYIWSVHKSAMKSALLHMFKKVLNDTSYCWDWNDKGWQEFATDGMRILPIDALAGPYLPFSLVENLGSGLEVSLKQRCKKPIRYKGPYIISSNRHWNQLGYTHGDEPADMEVWEVRMATIQIPHGENLANFCLKFATAYGLDPEEFGVMKKYKAPKVGEWDC